MRHLRLSYHRDCRRRAAVACRCLASRLRIPYWSRRLDDHTRACGALPSRTLRERQSCLRIPFPTQSRTRSHRCDRRAAQAGSGCILPSTPRLRMTPTHQRRTFRSARPPSPAQHTPQDPAAPSFPLHASRIPPGERSTLRRDQQPYKPRRECFYVTACAKCSGRRRHNDQGRAACTCIQSRPMARPSEIHQPQPPQLPFEVAEGHGLEFAEARESAGSTAGSSRPSRLNANRFRVTA